MNEGDLNTRMIVTFPHIGNIYIGMKAIFESVGVDVIVPPKSTRHTMSLATKYSPEGVCIPFKLNLGNMIEGLEMCADTILNVAGHGTCRMGYYYNVQEKVLRDMGYQFNMILIGLSEKKFTGFIHMLKQLSNNAPWHRIISAFHFGVKKLTTIDDIEIIANNIRAMEKVKGSATTLYRQSLNAIDNASDHRSLNEAKKTYTEKLYSLPVIHSDHPIRVLVVGEIYVVMDPYANMDVELELGKLGVFTTRSLYLSRWLKRSLLYSPFHIDQWREVHKAARPYLKRDVGGDGWETVGEKVTGSKYFDAMVRLAPFTCMPEGTAGSIMPSTREQLPVLPIYCDEQTSKAGMITRLEAFVDMLKIRKKSATISGRI